MLLATVSGQILGMLCVFFFTAILVISVGAALGRRFLKHNEEARRTSKKIARGAVLKATRRWLK